MKYLLLFSLLFSTLLFAQDYEAHKYENNTFKIIHIEDDDIYRVGLTNGGKDFFYKSSQGEDLAKVQLTEGSTKCRGFYYRDGFFYSVNVENEVTQINIILKKINKNLEIIEERTIFSKPPSSIKHSGKTYFDYNENGFVLAHDYTSRIKVRFEVFTYDFNTDKLTYNDTTFLSRRNLKVMDFEISDQLNSAFIFDADEPIGTLKLKTLKDLETYLVYNQKEGALSVIKLTEDENYFERSFNAAFNGEELLMANLNFNNPSNILDGYTIKKYASHNESSLNMLQASFFPLEDFANREEWGPASKDAQKNYKKDKDNKNTDFEAFAAMEISDLIIENEEAIIIVREVFDMVNTQANSGTSVHGSPINGAHRTQQSALATQNYTTKRFKEFQITKVDLDTEKVLWWNRLYNMPYTNGAYNAEKVSQGDYFWTNQNVSRASKVYYSYQKGNDLVLLYPTYSALYNKNGYLESDIVNQRPFVPLKFLTYSFIGKTEINLSNGEVENSLHISDYDGLGKMISATIINLDAFYSDNEVLVTPIEHLLKKISVLKIVDK